MTFLENLCEKGKYLIIEIFRTKKRLEKIKERCSWDIFIQ